MSLKDNFNQAMKEIMKKDLVGKSLSEGAKKDSSLDGFLGQGGNPDNTPPTPENGYGTQPPPPASYDTVSDTAAEGQTADNTGYAGVSGGFSAADSGSAGGYTESGYTASPGYAPNYGTDSTENSFSYSEGYPGRDYNGGNIMPPPQPRGAAPSDRRFNDNEETTVISKNIVINGGTVTGFANVRIDGSVKGDVKITKDVNVTGKVVGDIECNNAVMSGSSIQGSVNSKGQIRMDRDSVLLGDVNTQYLDMNGRIKGTVDVSGKAEFKSDSVIIGDITASTITVLDGAVIKGYVNTTFLQESTQNVFPETITVADQ